MAETAAPSLLLPNPLRELHEKANAEFQAYAELEIVSTFGEPQAEYAAIRKGAALLDEPQRGILELSGPDRLSFLNNLLSNETWNKQTKAGLAAGQGVYAFFLNGKGRIFSDMHVLECGERTLLDMDARLVEPIRLAFDKYLFREQVTMSSRIRELHTFSIHGPGAAAALSDACGMDVPVLPQLGSFAARLFDAQVLIWRDDVCATSGFHLVVDSSAAVRVWTELVSRFFQTHAHGRRTLRPAGWAAYNAARIEGGRPIYAIDFDDSVLPAETGQLDRAVSLTKGCYLGQEIVARMHARGQVARQIVGLRVREDALPIAGAKLFDDAGNEVGGVTSSTVSPVLSNACIALGYVKKAFFAPGSVLTVPAEGTMRKAVVSELPFLKASV